MNGNGTPILGQFCLNSGILALGMAHAIRCGVNAEQLNPVCDCGAPGLWHGPMDGLREFCCDSCFSSREAQRNGTQINFTLGQLAWACSHDWFISGNLSEIVCRNEWIKDGTRHEETVKHTNFRKLRDWAGY